MEYVYLFLFSGGLVAIFAPLLIFRKEIKPVLVFSIYGGVFMLLTGIMSLEEIRLRGAPLTLIGIGSYTIVGYVEVSKDKQFYYQMILEKEGQVRLYTLPKDMIIIEEGKQIPTVLEVVEKPRLKKAVLHYHN